ncbi:MAG: hypothetical protein JKX94_08600 [Sneathiella sp.]|nr:hypothetical protein [Sneathiella sp.]
MKFLMFNLVVGAALLFLFTASKPDLEKASGETEEVFDEMIEKAEAALSKATASLEKTEPPISRRAEITPDNISAPPTDQGKKEGDQTLTSPIVKFADQAQTQSLSPEVARRRQEILNPVAPKQVEDDFKVIKREDRQEKLRILAENMELFSAEMSSQ